MLKLPSGDRSDAFRTYVRIFSYVLPCLALLCASTVSRSMPIDFRLMINPIQICLDTSTCANPSMRLFEEETDAVWSQAGIDIEFLPFQSFVSSGDYDLAFDDLDAGIYGPGSLFTRPLLGYGDNWFDDAPGHTDDRRIVDLWFLGSIDGGFTGFNIEGVADGYIDQIACRQARDFPACGDYWVNDQGHIAITEAIFDPSLLVSNLTLAHEIGHVLDLPHPDLSLGTFTAGILPTWARNSYYGTNNLMNSDGSFVTEDVAQIGSELGVLHPEQIAIARQSSFLIPIDSVAVPVPSSVALMLVGLLTFRSRPGLSIASRFPRDD